MFLLYRNRIILCLIFFFYITKIAANNCHDDDYIKASLLVAEEGLPIFSAGGHVAIRMECTQKKVDYIYEYVALIKNNYAIDYIFETPKGKYLRRYTTDYIKQYEEEKRALHQIELILNPNNEILLWSNLDELVDSNISYGFDFMYENCSSMILKTIEDCIYPNTICFDGLPNEYNGSFREMFPIIFKNSPWATFSWNILLGNDYDINPHMRFKIFPMAYVSEWDKFTYNSTVGSTPLFREPTIISQKNHYNTKSSIQPNIIFSIVIILALIANFLEYKNRLTLFPKIYDIILFIGYLSLSIVLAMLLCFSSQAATDWNWLILIFSPIHIAAYFMLNRYQPICLFIFSILLLVYIVFCPIIPQMQHGNIILIFIAILLRSLFKARNVIKKLLVR